MSATLTRFWIINHQGTKKMPLQSAVPPHLRSRRLFLDDTVALRCSRVGHSTSLDALHRNSESLGEWMRYRLVSIKYANHPSLGRGLVRTEEELQTFLDETPLPEAESVAAVPPIIVEEVVPAVEVPVMEAPMVEEAEAPLFSSSQRPYLSDAYEAEGESKVVVLSTAPIQLADEVQDTTYAVAAEPLKKPGTPKKAKTPKKSAQTKKASADEATVSGEEGTSLPKKPGRRKRAAVKPVTVKKPSSKK